MLSDVVLDTETTGLDPKSGHRITEIGCVKLYDRKIPETSFYQQYINPEREVDTRAYEITGLNSEFLSDKPVFTAIIDEFRIYLEDASSLIIHNAAFDMGFIRHEFKLAGGDFDKEFGHLKIIDSLTIARNKYPGQKNNLDALQKRLNIKGFLREKHGALLDAKILAFVYLGLTSGQNAIEFAKEENPKKSELSDGLVIPSVSVSKEELEVHTKFCQTHNIKF